MPSYDYSCNCGNVQEEFHSMKETPTVKCKKCGAKMSKTISLPQINMGEHKGTGLHEVDNI
jgi:putative FmdB family regulatory protein